MEKKLFIPKWFLQNSLRTITMAMAETLFDYTTFGLRSQFCVTAETFHYSAVP